MQRLITSGWMANRRPSTLSGTAGEVSTLREVAPYEKVMVVAAFIVLFFHAIGDLLPEGVRASRTGGSLVYQAVSGGIYLGGILTLLCGGVPKWLPKVLWRAAPLILLLLLTLLSATWSLDPQITVRRSIALLISSSFGLYIVSRFDLRTFLNLLTISFCIYAILALVAALSSGMNVTLPWQGFTGNKNEFARTVALTVALTPVSVLLGLTSLRKTGIATSIAAIGMLFLSRSATSIVAAFASIGLGTALYVILGGPVRGIKLRFDLRIVVALLVVAVGFSTVVWGQSLILELLGRDPTLSGRTKLWEWVLEQNTDKPWLGSGYRAFWIDDNTRYFFEYFSWGKDRDGILSDSYSGPTHSHSGYIDTYVELGIVGIVMLGAVMVCGLVNLRRALCYGRNEVVLVFSIVVSFLMVYAYSAKSILQHSEDLWFLFSIFFLFVVKECIAGEAGFRDALRTKRQNAITGNLVSDSPVGSPMTPSRKRQGGMSC